MDRVLILGPQMAKGLVARKGGIDVALIVALGTLQLPDDRRETPMHPQRWKQEAEYENRRQEGEQGKDYLNRRWSRLEKQDGLSGEFNFG
jgi:hypothetical protein